MPPSPTSHESAGDSTAALLRRWHAGDEHALEQIVARHLEWLTRHVERELGPKLRAKADVSDLVQEALLDFLRYAPRFVVQGDQRLRGLLARIVRNVLADQDDFFSARRRARARERPLLSDSRLVLDPPRAEPSSPSVAAQRGEEEGWIRLALELLDPESRRLVVLREWEQTPFAEIAHRLQIGETAARMRHHRAILRLADVVVRLKAGEVDAALHASEAPDDEGNPGS